MTHLTKTSLDRLIGRLLLVPPQTPTDSASGTIRAERAFGYSLLFSGIRCTIQYALLPFLLPLVGVATEAALPVMILINLVAMGSILLSLRYFWQVGYRHRWHYLFVAIVAQVLLLAFIWLDVKTLLHV